MRSVRGRRTNRPDAGGVKKGPKKMLVLCFAGLRKLVAKTLPLGPVAAVEGVGVPHKAVAGSLTGVFTA